MISLETEIRRQEKMGLGKGICTPGEKGVAGDKAVSFLCMSTQPRVAAAA